MAKINIPSKIFGIDSKEALERIMKEPEVTEPPQGAGQPTETSPPIPKRIATDINNLEDYIQLPVQRQILLVSKYRLGLDADVENAGKQLNLTLQETAEEQNGRKYIGNINWETAIKLNYILNGFTLNPRLMIDFIDLLKNGNNVKNGKDTIVSPAECTEIYNEITEKRNPWRAEWLDANYKTFQKEFKYFTNHHIDASGTLTPRYEKKIDIHVKGDCYVDWDFDSDGLPLRKSQETEYKQGKNVYHWYPREGAVARFRADSDLAYLSCNWDPSFSDAGLGVRRVFLRGT